MKFSYQYSGNENLLALMRRLGYHPSRFNESFIRLAGRENYPRFHIYLEQDKLEIKFSLHLDQKKVSYAGHTAHSGDYDDAAVTQEKNRILSLLN